MDAHQEDKLLQDVAAINQSINGRGGFAEQYQASQLVNDAEHKELRSNLFRLMLSGLLVTLGIIASIYLVSI